MASSDPHAGSGAVAYLVERMSLGAAHAGLTGRSSDGLVVAAFTGEPPSRFSYPSDRADWRRCLIAYALAPPWLRERMRPTMRAYRAALRSGERWRWAWGCKHPRPSDIQRLAA